MVIFARVAMILVICLAESLFAAQTSATLSFKQWKQSRVLVARKHLNAVGARLKYVRQKTGNINEIKKLDIAQRIAASNLEFAQNMNVEDYFNFYLADFADRDHKIQAAVNKLSRREVAQLLKALLKTRDKGLRVETNSQPPESDKGLKFKTKRIFANF